jgi:hypothetical protein
MVVWYYNIIKRKEVKKMARTNTRGFYEFADGTTAWYNGLSATEKRNLVRQHGVIIRFIPD